MQYLALRVKSLRLDVNILTEEDLLFHYGLSPLATELNLPLGTLLKLYILTI